MQELESYIGGTSGEVDSQQLALACIQAGQEACGCVEMLKQQLPL